MNTIEWITLLLRSSGLIGIFVVLFRSGRFVQKLDSIEMKYSENSSDLKDIKQDLKSMLKIKNLEEK